MKRASSEAKISLWKYFLPLAILTFLLYAPGLKNSFVNWDDQDYIINNSDIHSINIPVFYSSFYSRNYQPLVMTVYSIIYQASGLEPFAYHLIQLLFHITNCGLVLWFIFLLTENVAISFIVSLLFAIHPCHVESVAWASELKDVMYGFGFLLSLCYYVKYIKEGVQKFYWVSFAGFTFSLLSKGMAVSLPLVLFLIDYFLGKKFNWKNKVLFLAISCLFFALTFFSQINIHSEEDPFTIAGFITIPALQFWKYISMLCFPVNLSALHPKDVVSWVSYTAFISFMMLVAITLFLLRKNKDWIFGIGFFLFTIAMVLQYFLAHADRYTYISSIGLFYLFTKVGYELYLKNKYALLLFVIPSIFCFQTFERIKIWENNKTLWDSIVKVYPEHKDALTNLAVEYFHDGDYPKALAIFNQTIQSDSSCGKCYYNRAMFYNNVKDKKHMCADLEKANQLGYEQAKEALNDLCK